MSCPNHRPPAISLVSRDSGCQWHRQSESASDLTTSSSGWADEATARAESGQMQHRPRHPCEWETLTRRWRTRLHEVLDRSYRRLPYQYWGGVLENNRRLPPRVTGTVTVTLAVPVVTVTCHCRTPSNKTKNSRNELARNALRTLGYRRVC
jgi:hypothetical protein